jgi:hypothetical protein
LLAETVGKTEKGSFSEEDKLPFPFWDQQERGNLPGPFSF